MDTGVRLTPIYGSGWIGADGLTREMPHPFDVLGTPGKEWEGVVVTNAHEFLGAKALISPRHVEADDYVNVEIKVAYTGRQLAVGCARVESL